jgi:hypothetical protein
VLRKFVYVQVYRGYFFARIVKEGVDIRFECAGLTHPRTLCGDYESICEQFRAALRRLHAFRFGIVKPLALIHLIPSMDGGYARAELRGFRQAAEAAGVGRTFFLDDKERPLSDEALIEIIPALRLMSGVDKSR